MKQTIVFFSLSTFVLFLFLHFQVTSTRNGKKLSLYVEKVRKRRREVKTEREIRSYNTCISNACVLIFMTHFLLKMCIDAIVSIAFLLTLSRELLRSAQVNSCIGLSKMVKFTSMNRHKRTRRHWIITIVNEKNGVVIEFLRSYISLSEVKGPLSEWKHLKCYMRISCSPIQNALWKYNNDYQMKIIESRRILWIDEFASHQCDKTSHICRKHQ